MATGGRFHPPKVVYLHCAAEIAMLTPEDIPHSGPPDTNGWWLIQVPTQSPYLVYYDNDHPPDIEKLWQSGFKCWCLDQLAVGKLPELLTSLLAKPKVFWGLAQAFSHIQVAGPWTRTVNHWVRMDSRGKVIAFLAFGVASWEASVRDSEFLIDVLEADVEAAQGEVDKRLQWAGYFLMDAA